MYFYFSYVILRSVGSSNGVHLYISYNTMEFNWRHLIMRIIPENLTTIIT